MRTGLIYKYTNLINGKVYIGQTSTSLEVRHKKHLQSAKSEADNGYFHRAIKKYGIENFSLEIIEEDIPIDKLDEREKHWIAQYDSFYVSGKGYNLTAGGKWSSGIQKLSENMAEEIKNLIENSTMSFPEISQKYNVSIYCISDINRGRTFFESDRQYPIRKTAKKTKLSKEEVDFIIDSLYNRNDLSIQDIALTLGISDYTVGQINRGKSKTYCPENIDYPIRKAIQKNTYQNTLTEDQVILVCKDLIFSNLSQAEIGKKYGIAKNTVGDISRGLTWKEITNQFLLPIKTNAKENKSIFESIYGIV